MEIDIELVKKVNSDLTELAAIVDNKQVDKDIVLDRLNEVIRDIDELNTIREKAIEEYKLKRKEWEAKMAKFDDSLDNLADFTNRLQSFTNRLKTAKPDEVTKIMDEMSEIVQQNNDMKNNIKNLEFDFSLLTDLLAHDMSVEFAKTRKRWLWKNKIIFRNINLLSKLITIFIGFSFGFISEKLAECILPKAPDYIIGSGVAIILYFTIEKIIDRKASDFFWKEAKRETLTLIIHYETYAKQTIELFKFILAAKKIL